MANYLYLKHLPVKWRYVKLTEGTHAPPVPMPVGEPVFGEEILKGDFVKGHEFKFEKSGFVKEVRWFNKQIP